VVHWNVWYKPNKEIVVLSGLTTIQTRDVPVRLVEFGSAAQIGNDLKIGSAAEHDSSTKKGPK
jgi:hypothetical protein